MDRIEMLDLKAEDHSLRDQIDQAIDSVINRGDFINGLSVRQFQDDLGKYLEVPYIIPCGNGTDALQLCLMALDLPKGGEIITPAFSYGATAEVIILMGYTPVYVDVDPGSFNINPDLIEAAVTDKTCAILPVHLYGQCADMNAILSIARKYDLKVIEDAAQAVGSGMYMNNGDWLAAGTIGDLGGFSFFPSKNLGCYGDGGAIVTRDPGLAEYVRSIANHGQKEKDTHEYIGVNSRLDSIQAAILSVKLRGLKKKTERRQEIARMYDRGLNGLQHLQTPQTTEGIKHVYHQYTLRVNGTDRDEIMDMLKKNNISTRIYYPTPLHLQPAFKKSASTPDGKIQGSFPIAEKLSGTVFSIPVHPALTNEEVDYIIETISKICSDR